MTDNNQAVKPQKKDSGLFYKVAVTAVIIILACVACTSQTQASRGGDATIGAVPNDICIVDGKPWILGVNIENEHDVVIVYVSTSNQLISQYYGSGTDLVKGDTRKQGKIIFTGVVCPKTPQ